MDIGPCSRSVAPRRTRNPLPHPWRIAGTLIIMLGLFLRAQGANYLLHEKHQKHLDQPSVLSLNKQLNFDSLNNRLEKSKILDFESSELNNERKLNRKQSKDSSSSSESSEIREISIDQNNKQTRHRRYATSQHENTQHIVRQQNYERISSDYNRKVRNFMGNNAQNSHDFLGHRVKRNSRPNGDFLNEYAVVIDAGSSGSRARIYTWPREISDKSLPDIKEVSNYKVQPGVSEYAEDKPALREHVVQLINKSAIDVPKQQHAYTPIYFMATAGMRMLLEDNAYDAIQYVQEILSNSSLNPFWFGYSENARILSGEEEGVFAWIAVNYLSGVFDRTGKEITETYGILELGGASTQIAFVPRGNILADKFPILIGGVVYSLYVHSYLHYGQKVVDNWIKEQLCHASHCLSNPGTPVENPCMLLGDTIDDHEQFGGHTIRFHGTGDPARCSDMLHLLVYKVDKPWHCFPKPCAIGSSYQPTVPSNKKFFALGAFWPSLNSLGVLRSRDNSSSTSPENISRAAFEFCKRNISLISKGYLPGKRNFVSTDCLMGLYMSILFTKGYGFRNDSAQIRAVRHINSRQIEWSLGAVLYENERMSCNCPTKTSAHCSNNLENLVLNQAASMSRGASSNDSTLFTLIALLSLTLLYYFICTPYSI